jgi:hypothetical protein
VLARVQDGVQVVATQQSRVAIAQEIMARFMARSGVTGDCEPMRYLWTDAFAVCNLLALAHLTEQAEYLDLAGRLALSDPVGACAERRRVAYGRGAFQRVGPPVAAGATEEAAAQRESALWLEHQDINEVMLATALVPEGTLRLSQ